MEAGSGILALVKLTKEKMKKRCIAEQKYITFLILCDLGLDNPGLATPLIEFIVRNRELIRFS